MLIGSHVHVSQPTTQLTIDSEDDLYRAQPRLIDRPLKNHGLEIWRRSESFSEPPHWSLNCLHRGTSLSQYSTDY